MLTLRTATLPLLAAVVAISGCGGGGGKQLSKAEYIKQADAICTDYAGKQKKLGEPKSVKDIERLANDTKPLVKDQIKKLRALNEPDSVSDNANAAYDLLEKQLGSIDDLVAAAKANDVKKISQVATDAGKISTQASAKAKAIGLKVCGNG